VPYFHVLSNTFPRANIQAKEVNGNFFFKDINTINDGKFASYNDDRIVFYADNWAARISPLCASLQLVSLIV